MNGEVFVYALRDPEMGQVGYVGASITPEVRYNAHLTVGRDQYHEAWEKEGWIRSLWVRELRPTLEILEQVPPEEREEAEERWIVHFEDLSHPLTNRWRINRERRARLKLQEQRREERAQQRQEKSEQERQAREEVKGYLRAVQVPAYIGCAKATAYRWIERGILPTKRIGKGLWVSLADLDRIAPNRPLTLRPGNQKGWMDRYKEEK